MYLEDILDYPDDDQDDIQSFQSNNEEDNQSLDYYPQYQSFSYSKMRTRPICKIQPNSLKSKSLSHSGKDNSEYKELFNKDFFARHNEHKR